VQARSEDGAVQRVGSDRRPGGPDASQAAGARTVRRRLFALVLLLVALGAGGAVYYWLNRPTAELALLLYGNVDIREAQPAFNDTGRIAQMLVQEGAIVKKGQLIATLDDTAYGAILDQAEAQMRNQQQVLAKLTAGSRPEEIAQAKATMEALRATYENNQITYRRFASLAATNAASLQQRDDAKAAFDAVQHQYEAAARAGVQAAEAAVVRARHEFNDTKLFAPADGVIENRIFEPGDIASPLTPVYTIALLSPLWARAYVAEDQLGKIALGMRATLTTDSFPGRTYHGWIGFISPTAEFTPKAVETTELRTALVYQVRVYVCDARNELRLGMPATVHVDLGQKPSETGGAGTTGCGSSGDADAK
jgi:HlyD family secretion protein